MNIDDKIAVMLAYKAGKKIEYRTNHENEKWRVTSTPAWNFEFFDYRVKSEKPQVIFINKSPNGFQFGSYFNTAKTAKAFVRQGSLEVGVKYIQVTPEVEAILTKNGIDCNESDS